MPDTKLILAIPQGTITATSLGIEGFARHRSPGSGKHFQGRKVYVELAVTGDRPAFPFLDEGGWRDADGDTAAALAAVGEGKRTKTALSNNAFSCTPLAGYERVHVVKTGGDVLALENGGELHRFETQACEEGMAPDDVARAVGLPAPGQRQPRLYMVVCPVELLVFSNLTPEEYAWYATHRPGKVFRQVVFTELKTEQTQLAAHSRFVDARNELRKAPDKKTKTVVTDDCLNEVPFAAWVGHGRPEAGGLYLADRERIGVWRFPAEIPHAWERASG
jgi:hypothetical protein